MADYNSQFIFIPEKVDFAKPFQCVCDRCKQTYMQQVPGLLRIVENYFGVCPKCSDEWKSVKAKAFYDYWPENPDFKESK